VDRGPLTGGVGSRSQEPGRSSKPASSVKLSYLSERKPALMRAFRYPGKSFSTVQSRTGSAGKSRMRPTNPMRRGLTRQSRRRRTAGTGNDSLSDSSRPRLGQPCAAGREVLSQAIPHTQVSAQARPGRNACAQLNSA
jgi:hypothetical protein